MSKRAAGKFERREGDAYYTPRAAVLPLIPYLRAARVRRFAEPCCGDGAIVRHSNPLDSAASIKATSRRARTRWRVNPRRARRNHHEPALHPQTHARADLPLREDRADVAPARAGLGSNEAGVPVPALVLRHPRHRAGGVYRGIEKHRIRQLRVIPVRREAYQRADLSHAGLRAGRATDAGL